MKSVGEHVDAVGIRGDIGRTRAEECAGVVGLERRRKVRRIARYVRAVAAVETETNSGTLDQRVREFLEKLTPQGVRSARQFMEELAMLKRWYYRSHKVGEIVLARPGGDLSIRKIANAVGRVYQGEKESTIQPRALPERP